MPHEAYGTRVSDAAIGIFANCCKLFHQTDGYGWRPALPPRLKPAISSAGGPDELVRLNQCRNVRSTLLMKIGSAAAHDETHIPT
jgi:hypothetical protein